MLFLGTTDGTLPCYSLLRLAIRKRKKENQGQPALAAQYCYSLGPLAVMCQLSSLTFNRKNICSLSELRSNWYLAAEVGLWQAVPVHHVDQVIQDIMEDAMEFLASKCCALDLRQGARVQFSLETQQRPQCQ